VELNNLMSGGPAETARLRKGDIIIQFDGVPIRRRGELIMRVRRAFPDSTVKVVVIRDGERLERPVTIGRR